MKTGSRKLALACSSFGVRWLGFLIPTSYRMMVLVAFAEIKINRLRERKCRQTDLTHHATVHILVKAGDIDTHATE